MNLWETPTFLFEAARSWWISLVSGVIWILFGMWLWSYRVGSLVALVALIGISMIFNGVTEIMIGSPFVAEQRGGGPGMTPTASNGYGAAP
jgi:uncharacterized membrane protein HdeD (DUF308 family)